MTIRIRVSPWLRALLPLGVLLGGISRLILIVAIAGLLAATMLRFAPGFDADERQLDPRLDRASVEALRSEHASERNVASYYLNYLRNAVHGDFGKSRSLAVPVADLIRQRAPVTLRLMGIGLVLAWLSALALAVPVVLWKSAVFRNATSAISAVMLSVPAAAVAMILFITGKPVQVIIALVLFPRIFEYLRNLLVHAAGQPHVLTAWAKGVGPIRVFFRHILPVGAPQFATLLGISVSIAFSACIPAETFCDLPGIGQLAWHAAISRDMPVLVTLTMLVAIVALVCNSMPDWITRRSRRFSV